MARCMACRKSLLKCDCWKTGPGVKKKPATRGKRVENVLRNGIEWCGTCTCRVVNGRCMNTQCSQNKNTA